MQPERDLRAAAERIESLLGEVSALGDSPARAKAEELVRLLMSLYGAGLDRIMEIIAGDGWGGEEGGGGGGAADCLFDRLADDGLVEHAIEKAAPEVTGIEVEGLPADAAPAPPAQGAGPAGLLQIGQTALSCPAAARTTP